MMNETKSQTLETNFGVNVWWYCPEVEVPTERAEAALVANGFDPKNDMPVLSRRAVVARAVKDLQNRRTKEGRRCTEKVKETPEYISWGILERYQSGDEEMEYKQSTTIRLYKDSGRVEVEGPLGNDVLAGIERLSNCRNDEDIRNFLSKVVATCYGLSKRPSGGIYFVPAQFQGILFSAQNAVAEMGTGARLYVERVFDGQQERAIVWNTAEEEMDKQIGVVLDSVSRIEKRMGCVVTQQGKLEELNKLMEVYQGLLGEEAKHEEISKKLADAANTVADKLATMGSERETALAEKKAAKIASPRMKGDDILNACERVLAAASGALHYLEIAEKVQEGGLMIDPDKVNGWLSSDIRANGEIRFRRAGRGVYGLASIETIERAQENAVNAA